MTAMDVRTGLIIAILLALLGIYFGFRAGIRSLQRSRRQASWPARRQQVAAGRRYFGLAVLLILLSFVGVYYLVTGKASRLAIPLLPPASTQTTLPSHRYGDPDACKHPQLDRYIGPL